MTTLDPERLRALIRFTLLQMNMYSETAEELLLGTAAHESHLGRRLTQYPNGSARGLYQMEPEIEAEIWDDVGHYQRELLLIAHLTGVDKPSILNLQFNSIYATAMARLQYHRSRVPLPDHGDLPALAAYWKRHWHGNGQEDPLFFIRNYERFILNRQDSDPPP